MLALDSLDNPGYRYLTILFRRDRCVRYPIRVGLYRAARGAVRHAKRGRVKIVRAALLRGRRKRALNALVIDGHGNDTVHAGERAQQVGDNGVGLLRTRVKILDVDIVDRSTVLRETL